MPKMVVCEVFEVTAPTPEDAVEKSKEGKRSKKSVIYAAPSLRELPHPVHLLDAEAAFGSIGAGGKAAPDEHEGSVDTDG